MSDGEYPSARAAWPRLAVAIALGAAAVGGLGVWLYLRAGNDPNHRASHRIEELQQRLSELAEELGRYAGRQDSAGQEASGS